jgi:hypothetical protein
MRSLRDWIAAAPPAALAAALAVVVLGAGLSGFAIAELTSGGGGDETAAPVAPSVVGGSTQDQSGESGVPPIPNVVASVSSRAEAVRAARKARAGGATAEIVRFGDRWLVLVQSSQ